MEIGNIQNNQYAELYNQEKVYISKGLYEEAKNENHHSDKTAVIFNNKVTAVENETLESLKNEFPNDFKKHEDILIATNDAEKYLTKNSKHLLNESTTDKDKDAITTKAESLDTKNIINKSRDELPAQLKGIMQKNNSGFTSANEMLNLKISLDKDKDKEANISNDKTQGGNISNDKAQDDNISNDKTEEPSNEDKSKLDELYEKQKKLQKQVSQLTMKMSQADENEAKVLESKLTNLNAELSAIQEQIMAEIKAAKV